MYDTRMAKLSRCLFGFVLAFSAGCREDKPKDTPPPPPPPVASATKTAAICASGGGELTDPVSAPFFPKTVGGYCIDPQGEVRTYGEKGKLSMDEVCTTAFDGECEVYKRFGLKRVVSLHYVDGSGNGGSVEVNLSKFADAAGAYGMYTLRVVAGDPADPSTPKVLAADAAGAIGTGRAYVWRGEYLVELQYVNEQESPAELAKSSEAILSKVGPEIGAKLPGDKALPPSAQVLPEENRVPNGIVFSPKDVFGYHGVGPAATGFYKDGDRRWRVLAIVKPDADQAKDVFKTLRTKPGALPVPNVGDEAVRAVVTTSEDEGKSSAPKPEFVFARKGNVIWGVGDEEYALREGKGDAARLTNDDRTAKLRALLALPAPTVTKATEAAPTTAAPSPSTPSTAAPSPAAPSTAKPAPSAAPSSSAK